MPAQVMTPELKREVQAMRLRNALDPKRFYKGAAKDSKTMPEFFQVRIHHSKRCRLLLMCYCVCSAWSHFAVYGLCINCAGVYTPKAHICGGAGRRRTGQGLHQAQVPDRGDGAGYERQSQAEKGWAGCRRQEAASLSVMDNPACCLTFVPTWECVHGKGVHTLCPALYEA